MTIIPLLIAFLFQSNTQIWVPPESALLKDGINHVYSVRFDQARQIFKSYQEKYPQRPEGFFLEATVMWWEILLLMDDKSRDSEFHNAMDKTIKHLESLRENSSFPDVVEFYRAGALGFKARLHGNREEWFEGANAGRKAYSTIEKALSGDFNFADAKFGTGIYKYYAEMIPDKYPIVKPIMLFFPPGSKIEGIQDILYAAENGLFTIYESFYFLLQIYMSYENDMENASKIADLLYEKFPSNPHFQLQKAIIDYRLGNLVAAEPLFNHYLKSIQVQTPYFADYHLPVVSYYLGKINERRLMRNEAITFFRTAIKGYQDHPAKSQYYYYVESLMSMAYVYERLGEKEQSINYYTTVLTLEDDFNWHNRARNAISRLNETL